MRGNHEQLMLDALKQHQPERLPECLRSLDSGDMYGDWGNFDLWTQNGGWECLKSYGVIREELNSTSECWSAVPQQHIDFLAKTRLYHRQDGFLFVHAGAAEQLKLDEQMDTLLWERHAPLGVNEIHVVGHVPCPAPEPVFEPTRYNLDTGSGRGRRLTACDVITREYWQNK